MLLTESTTAAATSIELEHSVLIYIMLADNKRQTGNSWSSHQILPSGWPAKILSEPFPLIRVVLDQILLFLVQRPKNGKKLKIIANMLWIFLLLLKYNCSKNMDSSICQIELFNIFREQYAWPSISSEGIPNMRILSKDIGKRTGIPCKKYK